MILMDMNDNLQTALAWMFGVGGSIFLITTGLGFMVRSGEPKKKDNT